MNDSEAFMNSIANTCREEPIFHCPKCNEQLHTDWVDNGFGPYSVQASPYGCECGWWETGCKECIKEKCFSWGICQGRALVNPLADSPVLNIMNTFDPNAKDEVKDQPADAIAQGEQATQESAAVESGAQDQAMEATQDSEEGSVEG